MTEHDLHFYRQIAAQRDKMKRALEDIMQAAENRDACACHELARLALT